MANAQAQTSQTTNPVSFFKALSDETRLKTLLLLRSEGELCVCELTEALVETQPKISRHLALLRQQGLLADRRQGVWIFYQIDSALPDWCFHVLNDALNGNRDFIEESQRRLKSMGNRPERLNQCCP